MGVRHRELPIEGVQFHPESILTEHGHAMLRNFLTRCRRRSTTCRSPTPKRCSARIEHREIFHDEMLALMRRIMSGEMSPVMIAAITIGLRVKKETIGEIAAAAQVMREFATPVAVADRTHLVDIVGTGGDGAHTFNISTAVDLRRRRGRRARGQARRAQRVVDIRQRRRAGGARRQHHADARAGRRHASPRPASASCSRRTTTPR